MISFLVAVIALSPNLFPFMISYVFALDSRFVISLLVAATALFPNVVSLYMFALGCRYHLVPKLISLVVFALRYHRHLISQVYLPS